MDQLTELATEYDLTLIEDAAQAHGATYDGQRVGSIGDVACFSFYPTKNMTTGEGGMITTDDPGIAERAARFVNHGRTEKYGHSTVGHNFRMTSIAAAIGRVQLDRLPEYIKSRRQNAAVLTDGLDNSAINPPIEPDNRTHVYHQYTVQTPDRDKLKSYLAENDIGSGVYYPTCMHEQPVYDDISHEATVGERAAEEVLSLPVHPEVSDKEITYIVDILQQYE
jgi:dTDP-4-amino-4,6-dideoxygalactose transaminase